MCATRLLHLGCRGDDDVRLYVHYYSSLSFPRSRYYRKSVCAPHAIEKKKIDRVIDSSSDTTHSTSTPFARSEPHFTPARSYVGPVGVSNTTVRARSCVCRAHQPRYVCTSDSTARAGLESHTKRSVFCRSGLYPFANAYDECVCDKNDVRSLGTRLISVYSGITSATADRWGLSASHLAPTPTS